MLRSHEMLILAEKANVNYYAELKEIETKLSKLHTKLEEIKTSHKMEMENLYRNYHVAKSMEKSECNKLKTQFDSIFPKTPFEFFTRTQIIDALGNENFQFMLSMRCLEMCGAVNDGKEKVYVPLWR